MLVQKLCLRGEKSLEKEQVVDDTGTELPKYTHSLWYSGQKIMCVEGK